MQGEKIMDAIATIDNAKAMFAVGETGERDTVWHRLGQRITEPCNKDKAMELAHLNFEAIKIQNMAENPSGILVPVNSYSVFRKHDNQLLASDVGAGYTIKQPKDCFQFADDLLEASNGAHYNAAGALFSGSVIWLSARIPNADIGIKGTEDKQEANLVFTTAYDGTMAHTALISMVRPICWNTLNSAISTASGIFRIKHTKNAETRFQTARIAMQGVIKDSQHLAERLNFLASRKMTKESLEAVIERLFPKIENQKVSTRRDNIIAEVLNLYANNDNNAIPQIAGTAYNLLNAVTEYVDHTRVVRMTQDRASYSQDQARAENAVMGSGEALKQKALAEIIELVQSNPASELAYAVSA